MSTKHTPGPWNYVQRSTQIWASSVGGCRMEEARHLIADVRGWGHIRYLPNGEEVQGANARLIAAAPDLLEALRYAVKQVPELSTVPGIAAAIAKALGEKND